ncbi:hypothetical protein BDZ97DRAFT_1763470 [Flammula alnicola]|nr:hypothetical protein BDZ97DRAFT_1763470 [Flammula alnicola]
MSARSYDGLVGRMALLLQEMECVGWRDGPQLLPSGGCNERDTRDDDGSVSLWSFESVWSLVWSLESWWSFENVWSLEGVVTAPMNRAALTQVVKNRLLRRVLPAICVWAGVPLEKNVTVTGGQFVSVAGNMYIDSISQSRPLESILEREGDLTITGGTFVDVAGGVYIGRE